MTAQRIPIQKLDISTVRSQFPASEDDGDSTTWPGRTLSYTVAGGLLLWRLAGGFGAAAFRPALLTIGGGGFGSAMPVIVAFHTASSELAARSGNCNGGCIKGAALLDAGAELAAGASDEAAGELAIGTAALLTSSGGASSSGGPVLERFAAGAVSDRFDDGFRSRLTIFTSPSRKMPKFARIPARGIRRP